ncbi:predicted protein [Plenodomus lingam JN3]|uniref:Predicted protein n=1 Tax=Leptosphaeria maculans (strain JN3 / isolate v23.1.3 / race Av1-4-5-6-7-8) TaxID=985895 RepID=E4ZHW0_LEPMJ|nr:predicted protein [Plenodomus lingam JN3]CBX90943.1 predicted protein [Plenodomus lingam JN3]
MLAIRSRSLATPKPKEGCTLSTLARPQLHPYSAHGPPSPNPPRLALFCSPRDPPHGPHGPHGPHLRLFPPPTQLSTYFLLLWAPSSAIQYQPHDSLARY